MGEPPVNDRGLTSSEAFDCCYERVSRPLPGVRFSCALYRAGEFCYAGTPLRLGVSIIEYRDAHVHLVQHVEGCQV